MLWERMKLQTDLDFLEASQRLTDGALCVGSQSRSHQTPTHSSVCQTSCAITILPMRHCLFPFQLPVSPWCVCVCVHTWYIFIFVWVHTYIHIFTDTYVLVLIASRYRCTLTLRKYLVYFLKKKKNCCYFEMACI